tara:strand:+ start:6651 stop:7241 length:591 start_codon:yes stop_codon:yes gene_type:complete
MKQMRETSNHKDLRNAYKKANSILPKELPYISKAEACRVYKKLIRKFGVKEKRHPWKDQWQKMKMPYEVYQYEPRKVWVCLTGNSSSLSRGWRRLIHDVAHKIFRWRSPRLPDHCTFQAELETEIVQYVNDSGWLNGSLKPKPKVKLSSDEKVSVKIKRLQDNIKHWETKVKRANTYLKTYRYKLKRYKRTYSDKF